jgi:hypothetical protein
MRKRWLGALGLVAVSIGAGAVMWTASSGDGDADHSAGDAPSASDAASTLVDELAAVVEPAGSPTATEDATVIAEPDEYAEHIALLVFARDARTGDVDDLRARLLAEADPTLTDSGLADLVRMIAIRIPDNEMWARMRGNQQRSEWQTLSIWEPVAWQQAVTSGYAEPGWTMRNVSGIEVTHYVEAGGDRVTSRERTLSVLMRCPAPDASVDRCHLALLSTTPVS